MNKERRKQLDDIAEQIGSLKDRLQELRDEEEEALNNMPESLQSAEKGGRVKNIENVAAFSFVGGIVALFLASILESPLLVSVSGALVFIAVLLWAFSNKHSAAAIVKPK